MYVAFNLHTTYAFLPLDGRQLLHQVITDRNKPQRQSSPRSHHTLNSHRPPSAGPSRLRRRTAEDRLQGEAARPADTRLWGRFQCRPRACAAGLASITRGAPSRHVAGTANWSALIHLFPANLGDSACISEIVQAISAVRQFGGRSGMIRQPQCRNWLHFYRITCRLSKTGRKKVYVGRSGD